MMMRRLFLSAGLVFAAFAAANISAAEDQASYWTGYGPCDALFESHIR